jgi:permuted papain-like amidase YaeF/Yiix C92 family enzyme
MDVQAFRRGLRVSLLSSLILAVVIVIDCSLKRQVDFLRGQLIVTFLGIAVGSIMALIDTWVMPYLPRTARVALGLLAVSQLAFYLLVWTASRKNEFYWRVWWIFMVASITSSHLLGLKRPVDVARNWIDRATPVCALMSGMILGLLALRDNLLETPPLAFWLCYALPAAGSVAGTWILWRRRRPRKADNKPVPMAPWAKAAWIIASQATVFILGVYLGMGSDTQSPLEIMPSALVGLPADKLDPMIRSDAERLRTVVTGIEDLAAKSAALHEELDARRKAENRQFYRPDEDDRIRWQFVTFLSFRAALLRIAATYGNYESVRDPSLRARCCMVGTAAAGSAFEASLRLITTYRDNALVRKKLNESEPRWGLPGDLFDKVTASASSEANLKMFHEMGTFYVARREEWKREAGWEESEFQWLDERIGRSLHFVQSQSISRSKEWLGRLGRRVSKDVKTPVYAAQSMLSEWIGDLRIVKDAPLITVEQVRNDIVPRLKPGDIFLERRNWFLSNAFLPGFWPHSAMYIGTPEDLKELGIADDPEVKRRWTEYTRRAHDGGIHTILESVSEGVIFNTAEESMHADHVAILRPRLSREQIAKAIVRAFSHHGKPYDFEFDFFTSDKLVCTELLYRAYEGMIRFDLVRIMGRDTLPALEIGRKFAKEKDNPNRELDFVLFVDGDNAKGRASLAGVETFIESLDRKREFNE